MKHFFESEEYLIDASQVSAMKILSVNTLRVYLSGAHVISLSGKVSQDFLKFMRRWYMYTPIEDVNATATG